MSTPLTRPTLALDIGGTKIAAGLVDADGVVLHTNRQPTPRSTDPEEVWAAAERTIADALAAAGRGQRGGHLLGRADQSRRGHHQPG
jgi:predicted NBD/HSP70 family sugar kinase